MTRRLPPIAPMPRRCRCRRCISHSLCRALWHMHSGRPLTAGEILLIVMRDLLRPSDPLCARAKTARERWLEYARRQP